MTALILNANALSIPLADKSGAALEVVERVLKGGE